MIIDLFRTDGIPAGMFTSSHFIAMGICFILILIACRVFKNISWERVQKITRIYAFLITFLEFVKIVYAFSIGHTWIDAWFPLSFCSLFIYSLWMAGFANGTLQKLGISFISIGALTGGFSFLIFPTTSLMNFPITHFLSLYSLFFHSSMVCFSYFYLKTCLVSLDSSLRKYYLTYFTGAAGISLFINFVMDSNLMLINKPYNIPISVIYTIASKIPIFYTLIVIFAYTVVPLLVSFCVNRYILKK